MTSGDDSASRRQGQGPLQQLLDSLAGLLATTISIGRTRVELLSVEVREELNRISSILVLGAVAISAAATGLLFAAMAVVIAYWDTHRILATVLVSAGFFAIAIIALLVIRARLRAHPLFLSATLAELYRDEQALRGPRS